MSIFSTDIERDNFEKKPTQQEESNILLAVGISFLLGITIPTLLILYADKIDALMNTKLGASLICLTLGAFGIWRFICLVKKWME